MSTRHQRKQRLPPDRLSGMVRSVRVREHRRLDFFKRKGVLVTLAVLVVVAAAIGYAAYLYFSTEGEIGVPISNVGPGEGGAPVAEGEPETVLLVGSDSRAGLTEKEQQKLGADDESAAGPVTGERADTLIIARIDPATEHITMVQFPRDLWVPIHGEGKGRINSALERSQAALVATVERVSGLQINRYVQINIAGFKDLVTAIDGVDVCIPQAIPFDPATGIEVKDPGMVHFSGERAIRFVRSRKTVAGGDLGRIQNQQKFMAAAIDKITSVDTLLHLSRIRELHDVAKDNLRVDEGTGLLDLYRLGQRFKAFNPDNYEAYTVPNLGPGFVGDASVVLPDVPAMNVLFDALRRNRSPALADDVPDIDPDTIRVGVLNGTYEEGLASDAARKLEAATRTSEGDLTIDDANIANAGRFDYKRTVIRYAAKAPEARRMARFVSAAIPGASVRPGDVGEGLDLEVIVGRQPFRVKKVVQILPLPIPKPGALPEVCRE
jgi:LCP family protein required for cell wall assembly